MLEFIWKYKYVLYILIFSVFIGSLFSILNPKIFFDTERILKYADDIQIELEESFNDKNSKVIRIPKTPPNPSNPENDAHKSCTSHIGRAKVARPGIPLAIIKRLARWEGRFIQRRLSAHFHCYRAALCSAS